MRPSAVTSPKTFKKNSQIVKGMYSESLALLAAASFGLSAIALKKGYSHSTPLASNIIVTGINAIILCAIAAFLVPPKLFLTSASLFFIAGGILGQGIARTFRHVGIDRIGASKAYTIVGSSALFASLFAILLLGERWTLPLFIGTIFVVGGIALLSGSWNNVKGGGKYLLLPFVAAVIYGLASVIQKTGLNMMPNSLVGATTAVAAALLGLIVFSAASGKMEKMTIGRAWPFFIAAGVLNSIAFILNFEALRSGNVTVVSPLISTQPLFVILFGFLFLKGVERITWKVAAGAALVVAGAAIVTAF